MPSTASAAFHFDAQASLLKKSASAASAVTMRLDSLDGVQTVKWEVAGTDELSTAAARQATFTAPSADGNQVTTGSAGTAMLIKCTVNGGTITDDKTGKQVTSSDLVKTAKIFVPSSNGLEVFCAGETTESDGTFGWIALGNALIRSAVTGSDVDILTGINASPTSLPNSNATLGVAACETIGALTGPVFVDSQGTLTANRTHTLDTNGAVVGDLIYVTQVDVGSFRLAVNNGGPGLGTLWTAPANAWAFAIFRFDGTNWTLYRPGTQYGVATALLNGLHSSTDKGKIDRLLTNAGASLTDASALIAVSTGRRRTLPAATLTANRVLTLDTTGAVQNDTMTITREDLTAFTYTLVNGGPGAGNVAIMPAGIRSWAIAEFDGTNWIHRASGTGLGS